MYFVVLLKNLISAAVTLDQTNSRPGIAYIPCFMSFQIYHSYTLTI